jgi:hypothetical protein
VKVTGFGGRRRRWIATRSARLGRPVAPQRVHGLIGLPDRHEGPPPVARRHRQVLVEQPHRSGIWRVWDGAKVRPPRASRDGAGLASFETALSLNAELEAPAS